jgi:hypothetical protein
VIVHRIEGITYKLLWGRIVDYLDGIIEFKSESNTSVKANCTVEKYKYVNLKEPVILFIQYPNKTSDIGEVLQIYNEDIEPKRFSQLAATFSIKLGEMGF